MASYSDTFTVSFRHVLVTMCEPFNEQIYGYIADNQHFFGQAVISNLATVCIHTFYGVIPAVTNIFNITYLSPTHSFFYVISFLLADNNKLVPAITL